jgi:hypothetical protein
MRSHLNLECRRFCGVAAAVLAAVLAVYAQSVGDSLDKILSGLTGQPVSLETLHLLEEQRPDPRTKAALERAFDASSDMTTKARLAATLIRMGLDAGSHYVYLSDAANRIASDPAPFSLKHGPDGVAIRGEFDAGFLNWCALNGKDPKQVASDQFSVSFEVLRALAYAQDPRSRTVFQHALESSNPLVVAAAVEGLGRLGDQSALPLVKRAIDRLPSGDRQGIAMVLPWFGSTEASLLMQEQLPNAAARNVYVQGVNVVRAAELGRLQRRTAAAGR